MSVAYFDLETSDSSPIGQILNYCFALVGPDFEVLAEESGGIPASRLQLPSPGAIAANRIRLSEQQRKYTLPENQALRKIATFIDGLTQRSSNGKLALVGYNSSKFDLNYLRTSFIRNGINPYFGGKLISRDLLHLVRFLYMTDSRFPAPSRLDASGAARLSLRLEDVSRQFSLLEGKQSHESRQDVILTIRLAQLIKERFGIDIATWDSYQGRRHHEHARRAEVQYRLEPNYALEDSSKRHTVRPVTLLDAERNSALWIDLASYKEGAGKGAVRWYSTAKDQLTLVEQGDLEISNAEAEEWRACALAATSEFKDLRVANFFRPSVCDIEADIYRLDFDDIDALNRAIWSGDLGGVGKGSKPDRLEIWRRYRLNNFSSGGSGEAKFQGALRDYALYRYGGKANLNRGFYPGEVPSGGRAQEQYSEVRFLHPNLNEMLGALTRLSKSDPEPELFRELEDFYRASEIFALCGNELLSVEVREGEYQHFGEIN